MFNSYTKLKSQEMASQKARMMNFTTSGAGGLPKGYSIRECSGYVPPKGPKTPPKPVIIPSKK